MVVRKTYPLCRARATAPCPNRSGAARKTSSFQNAALEYRLRHGGCTTVVALSSPESITAEHRTVGEH